MVGPVVIFGSGQMSMLWGEYNSAQTERQRRAVFRIGLSEHRVGHVQHLITKRKGTDYCRILESGSSPAHTPCRFSKMNLPLRCQVS